MRSLTAPTSPPPRVDFASHAKLRLETFYSVVVRKPVPPQLDAMLSTSDEATIKRKVRVIERKYQRCVPPMPTEMTTHDGSDLWIYDSDEADAELMDFLAVGRAVGAEAAVIFPTSAAGAAAASAAAAPSTARASTTSTSHPLVQRERHRSRVLRARIDGDRRRDREEREAIDRRLDMYHTQLLERTQPREKLTVPLGCPGGGGGARRQYRAACRWKRGMRVRCFPALDSPVLEGSFRMSRHDVIDVRDWVVVRGVSFLQLAAEPRGWVLERDPRSNGRVLLEYAGRPPRRGGGRQRSRRKN